MESVNPPTKYLTFAPWIYLVPQYKPESVLVLGYAGGTVAGLIRLLYGDIPITAVDIVDCEDKYGVTFIKEDARKFVKSCKKFDTVIVDIPNEIILEEDFINNLSQIANYIIVNTINDEDMSVYPFRKIGMNKPSGCSNLIYYFEVNKIKDLHPFK